MRRVDMRSKYGSRGILRSNIMRFLDDAGSILPELARKRRDTLSGFHVDRVKCVFPALDIKTDGVHGCPSAGERSRY